MNNEEYYKHFSKEYLIILLCNYSKLLDSSLIRIDKAIEYIENKMEINKECPIELLNILKGDK